MNSDKTTLHALLIGVNTYTKQPLDGCINDVQRISAFLESHCKRSGINYRPFHLLGASDEDWQREDIQTLLTQNPEGFQETTNCLPTVARLTQSGFPFFQDAQSGDICIFYYSGHGTRVNTPASFARQTADQKNQAIVLLPEPYPEANEPLHRREILIDKELGYLIWKSMIAPDNNQLKTDQVHFLAIMDCCYAGDATRMNHSIKERSMVFTREVPLKSYIGLPEYRSQAQADGQMKYEVPFAPHILLAAARPNQTSKEMPFKNLEANGKEEWLHQGVFTNFLVNELQNGGHRFNYGQLVERIKMQMEEKVSNQYPQIDPVGKKEGAFLPFLGGSAQLDIYTYQVFFNVHQNQWLLNAGSMQGIIPSNPINETYTVVERMDLPEGDPARFLTVTQVNSSQSIVKGVFNEAEQKKGPITVKLTQLAANSIHFFKGESLTDTAWQRILAQEKSQPLSYATLVENGQTGQYLIEKDPTNQYYVTTPGQTTPIFKRTTSLLELFKGMESMVRWQHLKDLRNQVNGSQLPSNLLDIQIQKLEGIRLTKDNANANFEDQLIDEPITFDTFQDWHSPIIFSYVHDGQSWRMPAFRAKIKLNNSVANRYPGRYHISAVYLSSNFGVTNQFLPHELLITGKDQEIQLSMEEVIDHKNYRFITILLKLEDQYLKYGVTEITDYLKIYVSRNDFSTDGLYQKGLTLDQFRSSDTSILRKSTKEKAFLGFSEEPEYMGPEWSILTIPIKIRRPLESLSLNYYETLGTEIHPGKTQNMGFAQLKSTIEGQAKWRSSQLLNQTPHRFPWGNGQLPKVFSELNQGGSELDLDYLELSIEQNRSLDNAKEAPIVIENIHQLNQDESILAYSFDPESNFILPAGLTIGDQILIQPLLSGQHRIKQSPGERSLGTAYGIFFKKFLVERFTRQREYPKLAMLNGGISHPEQIKTAIATTYKPVAVFIHGLYGDYNQAEQVFQSPLPDGTLLSEYYDVVLAFHYENLRTPIEESAGELKQLLEAIMTPDTQLHFFGYSMGGLVARYYIEHLKGHKYTTELVMLGTPNGGTIWADIQQWVVGTMTAAINLPAIASPILLPFLLAVGRFFMKSFDNFSRLQSTDSGILSALDSSIEAGQTRYHLLAGNTFLINSTNQQKPKELLPKLLGILQDKYLLGTLDLTLFNSSDNDLFATQDSMKACNFLHSENTYDKIPCGHFSYYSHPESLKIIGEIIKKINE